MKKLLLVTLVALCCSFTTNSNASEAYLKSVVGEIVYEAASDYYIVHTDRFFVLMERYSGPSLYRGDYIIGNLHSYGYKDVLKDGNDTHVRIYIENYWNKIDNCLDWLESHGKLR